MDQEFRWVKAQRECSPFEVFTLLRAGCTQDVQDRNDMRVMDPTFGSPFGFKLTSQSEKFFVLREGNQISASVAFEWNSGGVTVRDGNDAPMLQAALVIDDEGLCRLRVGIEDLTFWQFRKRALQDLFFNFRV